MMLKEIMDFLEAIPIFIVVAFVVIVLILFVLLGMFAIVYEKTEELIDRDEDQQ